MFCQHRRGSLGALLKFGRFHLIGLGEHHLIADSGGVEGFHHRVVRGTEAAPWYVVPADRKWYRNWAVGRLLLEHLQSLDPQYPPPAFDVAQMREKLLAAG